MDTRFLTLIAGIVLAAALTLGVAFLAAGTVPALPLAAPLLTGIALALILAQRRRR
ncbi:hypothetical protein [Alterinioella nitratireducens]|jgi:formate-dependent nitrite reductase membrane component NrfD|uniref:hypothetical protein n=1 Tax=Alterinioella nitratireducens TaxID=2735915 RepID=UPI004059D31D